MTRKRIQRIKIGDLISDKRRIIYSNTDKREILHVLKDGEEMDIFEIHHITEKKNAFLSIRMKVACNGIEGFLPHSVPYYSTYYKKNGGRYFRRPVQKQYVENYGN